MTGQREPRVRNEKFLAFIRQQPCCICGRAGPIEACHIRMGSPEYKKRMVGLGEKPHDYWCTAMCLDHHREQHSQNEQIFWVANKLNPFLIAMKLYVEFLSLGGNPGTTSKPKRKARPKPKQSAKIPSRPFPKTKRGWRQ